MKALVLAEYNCFEYKDMPQPAVDDDEVLVRVKACGICGSDVHGVDGSTGRRQPPIIMGHEAAGVIEQIGDSVTEWKTGDRVTFDSTVYCGDCFFCRRAYVNLCDNRRVLGVSCDEYRQHGALAEYVAVPQRILYRLPNDVTFAQAAMVEPVSIAVHAVARTTVSLSDTAVVIGTGMIGLLVLQALRAADCGNIIAVDIDDDKLALARKLGAHVTLRSDKSDVAAEVLKLAHNRGADIAFEVVGMEQTVNLAISSLRKGAQLTLVGNLSPTVQIPLQAIVTREISINGSCASCGEYPACLDMMAAGTMDVDTLMSAQAPLSEGASWFKRLQDGEKALMKVILIP